MRVGPFGRHKKVRAESNLLAFMQIKCRKTNGSKSQAWEIPFKVTS